MKQAISLFLAVIALAALLVGCGGGNDASSATGGTTEGGKTEGSAEC